eukprot:scaffold36006_cov73-Isochrysis_galbana.AAC.2
MATDKGDMRRCALLRGERKHQRGGVTYPPGGIHTTRFSHPSPAAPLCWTFNSRARPWSVHTLFTPGTAA